MIPAGVIAHNSGVIARNSGVIPRNSGVIASGYIFCISVASTDICRSGIFWILRRFFRIPAFLQVSGVNSAIFCLRQKFWPKEFLGIYIYRGYTYCDVLYSRCRQGLRRMSLACLEFTAFVPLRQSEKPTGKKHVLSVHVCDIHIVWNCKRVCVNDCVCMII